MKQTAVEFLESQYNFHGELKQTDFEQAKEMEMEQTIDAYADGRISVVNRKIISYEQYYNETFKSE